MRIQTAFVWALIHYPEHAFMGEQFKKIEGVLPLVDALFPGINYYSISGFRQVVEECVVPALKKRFPEVESQHATSISRLETIEVSEFLPSNGYEWRDSDEWKNKFEALLQAA